MLNNMMSSEVVEVQYWKWQHCNILNVVEPITKIFLFVSAEHN